MKIRRGSEDLKMLLDVYEDYPRARLGGHVVLDLGAHIGAFTRRALDEGAKRVISVEPWPANFALLRENIQDERATLLNIGCGASDLTFTAEKPSKTGGISGVIPRRKPTEGTVVKCRTLEDLVAEYKPTFVKIDIEAAEYQVLPCALPGVQQLCGELHLGKRERKEAAFNLLRWLAVGSDFSLQFLKSEDRNGAIMFMQFHAAHKHHLYDGCGIPLKVPDVLFTDVL